MSQSSTARPVLAFSAVACLVITAVYLVTPSKDVPVIQLGYDDDYIKAHHQHIEALEESTGDYILKNTLAHLETDRFLTVANHDYPKQNCVGFRFFRAADMCIDFDRIGFLVSGVPLSLLCARDEWMRGRR